MARSAASLSTPQQVVGDHCCWTRSSLAAYLLDEEEEASSGASSAPEDVVRCLGWPMMTRAAIPIAHETSA